MLITSCVGANGQDINDMRDCVDEFDLTLEEFIGLVGREDIETFALNMAYESVDDPDTFCLANDWHVSYHRSVYQGMSVAYLVHSAIEYIFTIKPAT